ncbi:MAG TPA: enoyl-CoA hydratase-related protein [Syntrophorhabdus sp.]|jgi:enoyl-CoA hydratase/carnithine racemase|nr:enoyl-CoA hydratase/isomerase family protein [Syntrophorhabdus sp.]MBP8744853.1 enoyl-CoA hydratase/isomerase family protein [Syntrophorhabdus sp.]NMC94957.1 enoyl-CoA hydratase/isomerase family protein [Syntrophorhabdus sp.]HNS77270.1 enoyl-CoA hydratase-related protein [Syntrophorhabdus sp.]HOD76629.1 enoyl-CoA hydratase-related protein [Syntrophorhabdus sp.]
MEYENILVKTGDDHVGEIVLNRPKQWNAFNTAMAGELERALWEFDRSKNVRVILVKAAGKAFCVGIDVSEFSGKTVMEYRNWIGHMGKAMITMSRICKPVIASAHGMVTAIGAGLVAASDLAIVSEDAKFGLTAINVGLNCIGPAVPVARSVGRKRTLELLFFGDLIGAEKALEFGFVNRVVPVDQLEQKSREWAVKLAQKSPLALQMAKKAFYLAADMDYYKAFECMTDNLARLCTTEDCQEGINAFMEKRQPVWKER